MRKRLTVCASKKWFLLISLLLMFVAFIGVKLAPNFRFHGKNTEGILLGNEDVLDRKTLFTSSPPVVEASKLKIYNSKELVASLEKLLETKLNNSRVSSRGPDFIIKPGGMKIKDVKSRENLHISFVGDSRIRQLFAAFLKPIPNYDRFFYPPMDDVIKQVSIPSQTVVVSKLLGLIASYYGKTLLLDDDGKDLADFFNRWLMSSSQRSVLKDDTELVTPHPDILIMGVSVHHMLSSHSAREKEALVKLKELIPVLQEVSKNCQVIWVDPYPTIEMFGIIGENNQEVHSDKIFHYNQRANKILQEGGIHVWNSGSPLVEEYIRGCIIHKEHKDGGIYKHYFDCLDYIHPGLSVITDMIQILFNLILPDAKVNL